MAKLVFKNYKIKLYGKDYSILVPDVDNEKFYICTYLKFFKHGENFIETDKQGLKVLRDSFAALVLEPEQMIYLPLKRRKPEKHSGLWEYQPDIVIYNHQIQFKRKLWKKLKQCMRYRKGEPYVMHVDYRELDAM